MQQKTGIGFGRTIRMIHLLRTIMTEDVPLPFSGICEADETFVGGKWINKPRRLRYRKRRRGHGTDKAPIVGVYSRTLKRVTVRLLSHRSEETVIGFMCSRLAHDAVLYTDGYKMNRAVRKYGVRHEYVNHHLGEYVRGDIHTNSIEGFWGHLKRQLALIGGIRRDRLYMFVGEIVWRFNHRKLSIIEQRNRLLKRLFP